MNNYPIHYSKDGTIAWSCVDADEVMQLNLLEEDSDPIGKWEGYIEGLKCLGLRGWLHELAIFNDCKIQMWPYPGLLRERVVFKFSGKRSNLERIKNIIDNQAKVLL